MFNVEEILKMTEEMGVNVSHGTDGKHYILDSNGGRVEFNTNMLMDIDEGNKHYEIKWEISANFNLGKFSSNYKVVHSGNLYISKSIDVNQYIIDAA